MSITQMSAQGSVSFAPKPGTKNPGSFPSTAPIYGLPGAPLPHSAQDFFGSGVGGGIGLSAALRGSSSASSYGSGYTGSPASSAAEVPKIYSDWSQAAKFFDMDTATAYQEHLENTSAQRRVKDLKAAGLNPALLYQHFQGADGVSYVGGNNGETNSSGGYGSGGGARRNKPDNGNMLVSLGTLVAGLAGFKLSGNNVMAGVMTANAANAWLKEAERLRGR